MSKRWTHSLAFTVPFLVAAALMAQGADAGKAKAPHKAGAPTPVVWPAAGLKWEPAAGAPPGVMEATLWGDPTKGSYGAIEKFPAGFSAPLHTHSSALRMVMISGTVIHGEEGKPDVSLSAGSYLYEPANHKHTTACDKASECVFFIEGMGKFDVKMVEEKKAPAKK